jgi:GT2 family glycosyltransferase
MPKITIVLVYWNSKKFLSSCLESMAIYTFQDFKIFLIDNGSSDETDENLKIERFNPDIQIEKLNNNHDFSNANNIGPRNTKSQCLALLNTDAFHEPGWLEQLLRTSEGNPEFAFLTSCQVQANDHRFLDGAGDAYYVSWKAWR